LNHAEQADNFKPQDVWIVFVQFIFWPSKLLQLPRGMKCFARRRGPGIMPAKGVFGWMTGGDLFARQTV
jgi:hypothetical protein